MTLHHVEPERRTLHGHFSRDLPPILTVASGDSVRFRTLDAGWNLEQRHSTAPQDQPRKFEPRDPERDSGHALCGPIAVRGAVPGMTLGVHVTSLRPGPWGWTAVGGWPSPVNDRLGVSGEGTVLLWTLDRARMVGRNQYGHTVRLRPFMGIMGLPPAEPGRHPTPPPRHCGGNIDCKELGAGSTLYLPVTVEGALFSTGDGHAAQGDGEVSTTAIECPMDEAVLTLTLHEGQDLATPWAETPAGTITFGFHQDLDEAAAIAVEAMIAILRRRYGVERLEALGLASVAVDLRVTQMVNGVRGVHAILPPGAIGRE
ncbi:MAG: acetamidase/formamidase family protein [Chloroflexota bacterium]